MRAMLTVAHGGREMLQLRDTFPDPQPTDEEVIVRVAATSVNFHDIFTRRGMPGVQIRLPVIAGSDIAGTVEAVGAAADRKWIGKRVLVDPIVREGDRVGLLGETRHGGRAERVAVRESMLLEIPAGVSFEAAASLPLAYGTAYRMMITRGCVRAGERVLVLGASGGVGLACVLIAKMIGAEVIACASSEPKLQRLRQLGADHAVNYAQGAFGDAVREVYGKPRISGAGGVDVAVNFTGGDTLPATQKCVKLRGRILCCGATAGFGLTLDARYWWTFEHSMIGSDGWRTQDLSTLLDLVARKRLVPVIDHVLPLERTAEAERMLEDREVFGKVLIAP
ncbi:MAG TPA: zinc-binding dehydrogenase [Steroidobacteraceae bacterium]|nr:zinc-binding dehydrogenase [Steroidobacteraceae bacterium]